jgi:predicted amidophosphoribosyltransferase
MSVVIFLVLAFVTAAVIAFPLLPAATASQAVTVPGNGAAGRSARRSGQAGSKPGRACPSCGAPVQPGDRFCVKCGGTLPQTRPAARTCPACGASLEAEDRFCRKCGHNLPAEGAQ